MADDVSEIHGFEQDGGTPTPAVDVSAATRERLRRAVAGVIVGLSPEEITAHLAIGDWPDRVREHLARPLELAEVDAHVDVLLSTIQAPGR